MTFAFEHSDELIQYSLEEFAQHGYGRASINAILRRAQMSKGQFYYHFANKEALYLALVQIAAERMFASKREQSLEHLNDDLDIFAIFEAEMMQSNLFAETHPSWALFLRSLMRERGNEIFEKAKPIVNKYKLNGLQGLIDRAYAKGDFRKDLSFDFVQSMLTHLFVNFVDASGADSANDLPTRAGEFFRFVRAGMSANPPTLSSPTFSLLNN